jgi:hypothetical protein
LGNLRIANFTNRILRRRFAEIVNLSTNSPFSLAGEFRDQVWHVTDPHNIWSVGSKKRLLCNIICSSSLLYLFSGVICVHGYDKDTYSANSQTGELIWGAIALAVGAIGIVHRWVWFWGIMHRKWASPLRALLIGATSIILGFLALGWGLHHTDPVLSEVIEMDVLHPNSFHTLEEEHRRKSAAVDLV